MKRALVVAALALAFSAGCRRKTANAPPPARPDGALAPVAGPGVWDQLFLGRGPRDPIPRDVALRAWVLTHGALPGVSTPPPDGSIPSCGLPAERWVRAHWGSLSPEQRAAIEAHERGDRRVARALTAEALAGQIAGYGMEGGACTAPPSPPWTEAEKEAARAMLERFRDRLGANLGHTLRDRFDVTFVERRWLNQPGHCGTVPAQSHTRGYLDRSPRENDSCAIELAHGVAEAPSWAEALVAHEVFHCFQYDTFQGTLNEWNNAGYDLDTPSALGYVVEGAAAWAGEELTGGTNFSVNWWRYYLTGRDRSANQPGQFDLFGANYDGIGFYAHLAGHGANVWRQLLPIVSMSGSQAFGHLIAATPRDRHALADWPASVARRPWSGGAWEAAGRRVPSGHRREPARTATLHPGGHVDLDERQGAQRLFEVPIADDVDVVRLGGAGFGRASFDGAGDRFFEGTTDITWCVRPGGCACPGASLPPDAVQVGRRSSLLVGLTAGPEGGARAGISLTARRACEDAPDAAADAPPPPGRCDPCLDGLWHIDKDNEREALRRVVPQATFSLNGDVTLRFACSDGDARGEYHQFRIDLSMPGAAGFTTRVIADGPVTARYRTRAGGFEGDNVNIAATFRAGVLVGGVFRQVPVPFDRSMFTAVPAGARYRCTADTLEFDIPTPNGTRLLRYRR